MSNAGKSLLVAGLCRVFAQDGYRVAPFKSQNMALNSFITADGLEMGRAQVMQAEAAGIEPSVYMNPVLLKPTNDHGSQVIVMGEVLGDMEARDYFRYKKTLLPRIAESFQKLEEQADIIVIEGAGSPAEINLKDNDIVNMGLAELVDAPVLLVGDIDRGGVFAQLLGTMMLLEDDERARVKGLVINKFRGDVTILDPGITMLEQRAGIPVTGVIPYMQITVDDEDSLSEQLCSRERGLLNIAVIRLPHISNFTDFVVFTQIPGVSVHYVTRPDAIGDMDMVILPGSKNTMGDMKWLRSSGMEAAVKRFAGEKPVFGICGGYQMLGMSILDSEGIEEKGSIRGMELLPMKTELLPGKVRRQVTGSFGEVHGIFHSLSGMPITGYEIHMGRSEMVQEADALCAGLSGLQKGNVYGSYVHGIFDEGEIAWRVCEALAAAEGISLDKGGVRSYHDFRESQFNLLADVTRKHMDMEAVYAMLREAAI